MIKNFRVFRAFCGYGEYKLLLKQNEKCLKFNPLYPSKF